MVIELANEMITQGHEVRIILSYQVDAELNQKNLDESIKVDFVGSQPTTKLRLVFRVFQLVRKYPHVLSEYDIIHCHLTFGFFVGARLRFARHKNPQNNCNLVFTDHSVGVRINPLKRRLFRLAPKFFDHVILVGLDNFWEKRIFQKRKAKTTFVPNGINIHDMPLESVDLRTSYSYEIGTISRLVPERNPFLFLELVKRLNQRSNLNVRLKIGGDGPEKKVLVGAASKIGIGSCVSFLGTIMNPVDFFDDICIYVTLCVREISGLAGLEAILSGVPVVGIQMEKNYRHDVNDWIFSSSSLDHLADHIRVLLANPEQRSAVINYQRRYILDNLTIQKMASRYLSVYSSIRLECVK